jgi:hypothetical protein
LRYIAVANTVAGADAPGGGARDIDAAGHGVVNAGGGELSLRSCGGGWTHANGLKFTIAAATQEGK